MLFMVWSDTGSELKAYCIPDSFTSQSHLAFYANGHLVKTVAPNALTANIGDRHQTCRTSFEIDESIIDGLSGLADLEVREADTDLLIYRRAPTPTIQQNVFRLETQLIPMQGFDAALKPSFRFWYAGIDRQSDETVKQILLLKDFASLYASGRILYSPYEYFLCNTFKIIMMMRDPYVELAARLLAFKTFTGEALGALLSERDQVVFEPVLDFAEDFQTFDPREIKSVFGRADRDTLGILSNPVVRQLTATLPTEVLVRNNVGRALGRMTEFEVVGIRERGADFLAAAADLLGLESIAPAAIADETVQGLADNLRAVPRVEALIEQDLELYDHILSAYGAV